MRRQRLALAVTLAGFLIGGTAFANATIVIINADPPGQGFNDPTPAAPIGGNAGATVGAQRLQAFNEAARIWGAILDSAVEIRISATFVDGTILPCDAGGATLGDARTARFVKNFPNAPIANTFYPVALANKLAGKDLTPGSPHIIARFSSALGTPACDLSWYYGLDGDHRDRIDLVTVLLHEFAHGLGFAGNVEAASGAYRIANTPAVFDLHVLDEATGLRFDQMSDAQRKAAILDSGRLMWNGASVRTSAAAFLGPAASIDIQAPNGTTTYELGTASFGAPLTLAGTSAAIVAAKDGVTSDGPSTTDGCSAFTNAPQVAGTFALVDRGGCLFITKAENAQKAGALGLILIDNRVNTPPGLSDTDPLLTIPVVSMTQADGAALRARLDASPVSGRIYLDATRRAGVSRIDSGFVRLYAPGAVEAGSSLYHFDTTPSPNLLMEPSISDDLLHRVDLTIDQLLDIGWGLSGSPAVPVAGRTILHHPHH
jgi:hypothetical protein